MYSKLSGFSELSEYKELFLEPDDEDKKKSRCKSTRQHENAKIQRANNSISGSKHKACMHKYQSIQARISG